jgi:hypothetical protein
MLTLLVVAALHSRITVVDAQHTRLSRIVQKTIVDELTARNVTVGDGGDYVAQIVDVSDASGSGRESQIVRDMEHAVEVTEIVGGAAAEVRLYDSAHALIATYRLSGSGSSSAAVGARRYDIVTSFIVAPLLRRSRSSEAARAIGHDIAAQIAAAIRTQPLSDAKGGRQ